MAGARKGKGEGKIECARNARRELEGEGKGMTVISKDARNGKINPKTHKNTPEVSQFYSFY